MTADPIQAGPAEAGPVQAGLTRERVLADLTGMLLAVTGEDDGWAARVSPGSRLEGDLGLESIELTALGVLLREAYGDRVDLPAFMAGLDIDQILGLTVGALAIYVTTRPTAGLAAAPAANPAASPAGMSGTRG